jgi:hypothetical protein
MAVGSSRHRRGLSTIGAIRRRDRPQAFRTTRQSCFPPTGCHARRPKSAGMRHDRVDRRDIRIGARAEQTVDSNATFDAQSGPPARTDIAARTIFVTFVTFVVIFSRTTKVTKIHEADPLAWARTYSTKRLRPCLNMATLKFISRPTRSPESFRYVRTCASWIGASASMNLISMMTAPSTTKSSR